MPHFQSQAKLAKCGVEGQPVAVAFGVGKGAIHIEKQGVQGDGIKSSFRRWNGCEKWGKPVTSLVLCPAKSGDNYGD
jgi:hypothetical protein